MIGEVMAPAAWREKGSQKEGWGVQAGAAFSVIISKTSTTVQQPE